ncbi:MAG: adenylate/guanylate cyclase domain-containing protein, partial [Armatimonadetes bacterium]|nr:adenylate/guanylate cyclase domain-containing protein [Armatimonadota bacterium]
IVRLQQVLQTGAADLCVMSVDVVKSILMKEGADRYEVEVSFRAFQEFIERNVRRHGGSIHSTAGDGAVAEFHGVPEAFACARAIQSRLPDFNARENRLRLPFQVRVGLHSGRVHGGLDEVVFTRVIDIAAHIEKAAPGGGIALSDAVTGQLPGEQFTRLAEQIDDQNVFLALHPAG